MTYIGDTEQELEVRVISRTPTAGSVMWTSAYRTLDFTECFCKPQGLFKDTGYAGKTRDAIWVFFRTGCETLIGEDGLSWSSRWTQQSTSLPILRRLLTVRNEWSKK